MKPTILNEDVLLRHDVVTAMIGLSKATLWRMKTDGKFPQPVRIGSRAVRWRKSDVTAWMASLHTAKAA